MTPQIPSRKESTDGDDLSRENQITASNNDQ